MSETKENFKNFSPVNSQDEAKEILSDWVYYDTGLDEIIISKKSIAAAVADTAIDYKAKILDPHGHLLVSTVGFFLDRVCMSQDEHTALLEELQQYQLGEKEIPPIKYIIENSEYDLTSNTTL